MRLSKHLQLVNLQRLLMKATHSLLKMLRTEMGFVFSKIKTMSKCFAGEETGKRMDSLVDTQTIKATHFTSWLMVGLQEWVLMSFTLSRDKKSITAVRVRVEMPFTRSFAMESKDNLALSQLSSSMTFMSQTERQLLLRMIK